MIYKKNQLTPTDNWPLADLGSFPGLEEVFLHPVSHSLSVNEKLTQTIEPMN